ncbi:MAG: chloride channel protein [Bacteroidetes bacterium]|nr:chloride channel protein [Bacteroidota bacterium]
MWSHMATSALTVGFGGSVGLEAPIVITGSAIGSNMGSLLHLGYKSRTLLIACGTAGAISGIFNAPIAGVLFTIEVLLLEMTVPAFIPILFAAIAGNVTTKLLLGEEILFFHDLQHPFLLEHIPWFILLGIICGFVSLYFNRLTFWIEGLFTKINGRYKKGLIAGVLLGGLILLFPPLYGEGFESIKALLTNNPEALLENSFVSNFSNNLFVTLAFITAIMFMKVVAMNVTLAGGGNGGYFAPSLFVGAIAGFVFAQLINMTGFIHIPLSNFTLVGMAGVLTGVLHAPLTGIFIIAEITSGYELMIPLMIVSGISYATIRLFDSESIYAKQLARSGHRMTTDKDKTVLTHLSLKRVMETDLKTVKPEMSLGEMIEIVAHSSRNIFPVVDEEEQLRGIILLDDIRHIMFKPDKYEQVFVKDIMHAPPAQVSLDEPMEEVMQKFQNTGAWNLPVVEDGIYVGFLSKSKIFSFYRRLLINQQKEM